MVGWRRAASGGKELGWDGRDSLTCAFCCVSLCAELEEGGRGQVEKTAGETGSLAGRGAWSTCGADAWPLFPAHRAGPTK